VVGKIGTRIVRQYGDAFDEYGDAFDEYGDAGVVVSFVSVSL
jgi:hypothetical protein